MDYQGVCDRVTREGRQVPSRFGPTHEWPALQVRFGGGDFVRRHRMNLDLAAMEAFQLVSGRFDKSALVKVAPHARHELFTPQMAYGPRLRTQYTRCLDYLRADPDGRQAVLLLNDRDRTCSDSLTCTLSMHLLVRDGELEMYVHMRSWDLVKGCPYDTFMFQFLKTVLARCLGLGRGPLYVTADSAHVYDADARLARAEGAWDLDLTESAPRDWTGLWTWCRDSVEHLASGATPSYLTVRRGCEGA